MSIAPIRPDFVLLVEDEALVRMCIAAELENEGIQVIEASDADQALRVFQSNDGITVVFTDINMPGAFDGLFLSKRIRELCPHVRLILTSGRSPPPAGDMPAGVAFLPKPYEYAALANIIRAA
jgi:CheY-like chemotaxis protein